MLLFKFQKIRNILRTHLKKCQLAYYCIHMQQFTYKLNHLAQQSPWRYHSNWIVDSIHGQVNMLVKAFVVSLGVSKGTLFVTTKIFADLFYSFLFNVRQFRAIKERHKAFQLCFHRYKRVMDLRRDLNPIWWLYQVRRQMVN